MDPEVVRDWEWRTCDPTDDSTAPYPGKAGETRTCPDAQGIRIARLAPYKCARDRHGQL